MDPANGGAGSRMKLVALLGSECTGKTTLARQLAKHFHTLWIPEFARTYWNKKQHLTIDDVVPIMRGQLRWEAKVGALAKRLDKALVICDTIGLSSLVYSQYYYGAIPPEAPALLTRKYALYLLTDTDVPWVDEPVRGGNVDRRYMHSLFVQHLQAHALPYTLLRGSEQERFILATTAITRLLYGNA